MKGLTNFTNSSEVSYESGSVKDKLDSLSTSVADTVSKTNGGTFENQIFIDQQNGTASKVGWSYLRLGNTVPAGTAGNSAGVIELRGQNDKFIQLYDNLGNLTDNRYIGFPDKSGTLALTSDIDKSNKSIVLYMNKVGGATYTITFSDANYICLFYAQHSGGTNYLSGMLMMGCYLPLVSNGSAFTVSDIHHVSGDYSFKLSTTLTYHVIGLMSNVAVTVSYV